MLSIAIPVINSCSFPSKLRHLMNFPYCLALTQMDLFDRSETYSACVGGVYADTTNGCAHSKIVRAIADALPIDIE